MARQRVSTTVDDSLLAQARELWPALADAQLFDEALGALVSRDRAARRDAAYDAYRRQPLEGADEWGSLAVFGATEVSS